MWASYQLVHKRGLTPLIQCPPWMLDVAECELLAEAELRRKKRQEQETKEILKARGLIRG